MHRNDEMAMARTMWPSLVADSKLWRRSSASPTRHLILTSGYWHDPRNNVCYSGHA